MEISNIESASESVSITVEAIVLAPIDKVWKFWTEPKHIIQWNHATDEWHCPKAENNLQVGGKFSYTMAAKDESFSFNFWGNYDLIKTNEQIDITMGDGRKWTIQFSKIGNETKIVEVFEAEKENTIELQRNGWQAILLNFKNYTEANE